MSTPHSPGPFTRERSGAGKRLIKDANGELVAQAFAVDRGKESDANWHLFAAAPELLRSVEDALDSVGEGAGKEALRAAIAAARGEAEGG